MTGRQRQEVLSLHEAANLILDECRMVLPGIQALFGFQLIAIFNTRFAELSAAGQLVHLAAVGLVVVAVVLVMAPAACHRQTDPRVVTEEFISVASRILFAAMVPLMAALFLDFYLIAGLIIESQAVAAGAALLLALPTAALWFVLPRLKRGWQFLPGPV